GGGGMGSVRRACLTGGAVVSPARAAPAPLAPILRSGPPGCRTVALTFDLCPVREGSGYDGALLDLLVARHVPATFFPSGRWIETHDAEVRALLAGPLFELGPHRH